MRNHVGYHIMRSMLEIVDSVDEEVSDQSSSGLKLKLAYYVPWQWLKNRSAENRVDFAGVTAVSHNSSGREKFL